jgi:hypothetical protein
MLELKWNILNVYEVAHDEQKEDFLRELVFFCSKNKEPYFIDGDLNILRFSYEKNKKFHPNRFFDIFNTLIQVNDLS